MRLIFLRVQQVSIKRITNQFMKKNKRLILLVTVFTFLHSAIALAQQVRGRILERDPSTNKESSVPGANIHSVNSGNAVMSDVNGQFTISASE
jgi:hypothetical protein